MASEGGRAVGARGTSRLTRAEALAIAGLAALPRLLGLHHVSLWLDEILGTLQASGSLAETWSALRDVRVHPPLWGLIQWLFLQVTDSEPLRRLLPIGLGVATVVLLADLAARWFGRRVAFAVAVIASVSPFHVHYSQELRAYALGLFFFVLTLWLVERARRSATRRSWIPVALALTGCFATLYVTALVLVPAFVLLAFDREPPRARRRHLVRLGFATLAALLAVSPWFGIVRAALGKAHELEPTAWTLDLAWRRWEFLTLAAEEGERGSALSFGVALVAIAGAAVAARSAAGRGVLAGAIAGSLGVELFLAGAGHWSNGRYSITAWPCLVLLLSLGCRAAGAGCARLWARWRPAPSPRALQGLVGTVLLVSMAGAAVPGLARYYRSGRPDWRGVAQAIEAVGSRIPLLATNEWTRVSAGYYLARLSGAAPPAISPRVSSLGAAPRVELPTPGDGCAILLDAGWPRRDDLDALFLSAPVRVEFRRTGARLALIDPAAPAGVDADPWRCGPAPVEATAWERPAPFARRADPWSQRAPPQGLRLELDAAAEPSLLAGWSYPERTGDGRSFRWALGSWASFRVAAPAARRIALSVWPFGESQTLALYRNHELVGESPLAPGRQQLEWQLRERDATAAADVYHFRFGRYATAEQNPRPLAAAFEWIELRP